ncbi:hypothetical protein ES708_22874 [subsurface metagenome]
MKKIFEIPFRTILLTVGILLFINLLVLLFGGLYSYYPAGEGVMYMRNRITGTIYTVFPGGIEKVPSESYHLPELPPLETFKQKQFDWEKASKKAEEIRQRKLDENR